MVSAALYLWLSRHFDPSSEQRAIAQSEAALAAPAPRA
jgi:hypothetical protein